MADSDDEETFVTFGTPVDVPEEDAPRKKAVPIHEQIVTDSGGRRRFHGAFTGGFSAGHFNTVGTKEGWIPSAFVSSRSKQEDQASIQRPEDFMDDEDFEEYGIAPKRIVAKQEFLSTTKQELDIRRKRDAVIERHSEHGIPGIAPLQDLVVPTRMSVGVELLKQMGWKEGQGVGPRVRRAKKKIYGCAPPSTSKDDVTSTADGQDEEDVYAVGLLFAPKDVDVMTFTPKDDLHGIGYCGIDPTTALSKQQDWLGMDPVRGRTGKMGIRGQAFGVGAFEEDDEDIYGTDNLKMYDIEMSADKSSSLHGWTGPPQTNSKGGPLAIFTKPSLPPPRRKHYVPPVVPRDFKPFHKFKESTPGEVTSKPNSVTQGQPLSAPQRGQPLSAPQRGQLLGETPLPTPKKSVFEFVSKEDKIRLESVKSQKQEARVDSKSRGTSSRSTVEFSPSASTINSRGFLKNPVASTSNARNSLSSTFVTEHSRFQPFAKDPAKQARYEEYLRGEKPSANVETSGLTEWQREREQEEFYSSAMLYRPLSSSMAARFTTAKQTDDHNTVYEEVPAEQASDANDQSKAASMKMFGRLTREQFEWHPDRLLCKRFNIPDPYTGSSVLGVPKVRKAKFSIETTRLTLPIEYEPRAAASADEKKAESIETPSENVVKGSAIVSVDCTPSEHLQGSSGQGDRSSANVTLFTRTAGTASAHVDGENNTTAGGKTVENAEDEPERPPMDLFKAIFADSSSEDESEQENENSEASIAAKSNANVIEVAPVSETVMRLAEGNDEVKPTEKSENKTKEERPKSPSPETYGPTLPAAQSSQFHSSRTASYLQQGTRPYGGRKSGKQGQQGAQWKERGLNSSDSEDEIRYKHKRKSKDKGYRDKDRSRHKNREKDKGKKTEKKTEKRKFKERTRIAEEQGGTQKEHGGTQKEHGGTQKEHGQKEKHTKNRIRNDSTDESWDEKSAQEKQNKGNVKEKALPDDKEILCKLKNIQALKGRRMRAADFM